MPVQSGITKGEKSRINKVRGKLVSNDRTDKQGNPSITGSERNRLSTLRTRLSNTTYKQRAAQKDKKPAGKKGGGGGNKLPEGITPQENKRIQAVRKRLLGNNRADKKGQVKGNRKITPAEFRRIQTLRKRFSNDVDVPSLSKFLSGDLTYKSQLSDLTRNKENFLTDFGTQKGDVNRVFGDTVDRMNRERDRSMDLMQSDFASRGLLHSGLFADQVGDYDNEFAIKQQELGQDRSEQLRDLLRSRQLFLEELRGTRRSARDEALRRRAQKYSLG